MKEQFDFGEALKRLKGGKRVERNGWNGKGMWLQVVREWDSPTAPFYTGAGGNPKVRNAPFIAMKTAQDEFVPWLASQTDVLAEDWSEAD